MHWRQVIPSILFALLPALATADVTDAAPNGFSCVNRAVVKAPPAQVWQAIVADVAKWWSPAHSWSGDAANFSIEARAGGCFCEALPGGGSVEHLRVVFVQPPKLLRMTGGLGPLQAMGVAGSFSFELSPQPDGGTRITLTAAVGGYRAGGLDGFAAPVDRVLGEQLARLAQFVDKH